VTLSGQAPQAQGTCLCSGSSASYLNLPVPTLMGPGPALLLFGQCSTEVIRVHPTCHVCGIGCTWDFGVFAMFLVQPNYLPPYLTTLLVIAGWPTLTLPVLLLFGQCLKEVAMRRSTKKLNVAFHGCCGLSGCSIRGTLC